MSNVSKLAIKACRDNKFSSFTGEFVTSINPENLIIKSGVAYHIPQGMAGSSLLKYCGTPPKLLSFSLLFDNTGIIPGSNTIHVIEQVKQLQAITYNVAGTHSAPSYIRVIWGQIDFKGRLVELDIVYSMFQVDGTLVRAEANIAVLEEIVPSGQGKSNAGIDSKYTKAAGVSATSNKRVGKHSMSSENAFTETPNGMHGAYSGAPPGAYDGAPDNIYKGSDDAGRGMYDSGVGAGTNGDVPVSNNVNTYDAGDGLTGTGEIAGTGTGAGEIAGIGTGEIAGAGTGGVVGAGGVAGNGPGGSGGGVGGGGMELVVVQVKLGKRREGSMELVTVQVKLEKPVVTIRLVVVPVVWIVYAK
jgi:hypothetical protein